MNGQPNMGYLGGNGYGYQPPYYGSTNPYYPPQTNQRMTNWTQPVQPTQIQAPNQPPQNYISARIINDPSEIKPNEVPGDGSPVVFPVGDRSCIYLKEMNQEGRIITSKYILDTGSGASELEETQNIGTVLERLDQIEKILKQNSIPHRKKKPAYPKKSEDEPERTV